MEDKNIATLTIHSMNEMPVEVVKNISSWLKILSDDIVKNHKNPGYSKRFTVRYIIPNVSKNRKNGKVK